MGNSLRLGRKDAWSAPARHPGPSSPTTSKSNHELEPDSSHHPDTLAPSRMTPASPDDFLSLLAGEPGSKA